MKKPALLIVLASLLLFVGACQDDTQTPTQPLAAAPGMTEDQDIKVVGCDEWTPTPPEILGKLKWEEFEGTLQPGLGGLFHVQSTTWGGGVYFSIQVPPNALPPGLGATDFAIRFPRKTSYLEHQSMNCGAGLPLILEMEPSHLVFNEKVTVHATYMPWTGVTKEDVEDAFWNATPYGEPELLWVNETGRGLVTFAYKTWHFSRWEVGGPSDLGGDGVGK